MEKLYEKVLYFFKRTRQKCNWFCKKKMLPLTKEELKSHQDAKVSNVCGKTVSRKPSTSINFQKVIDYCHYACKYRCARHSICNVKFNVLMKVPVAFHNVSNYDYHFIIKELANELSGNLKNIEKYKRFSVTIEKKVTKIDKDGNESVAAISYKVKVFDSARFMASSLSNLVDNLTEEIHEIKSKDCDDFREYEMSRTI